ncbi:phosphotransferase family protein [Frankia sp. CNm7]|uniref:Phosphotransferase family protein n=1 Tax=Frankia nepalensis TaxID=1836974 RepID=A0A937RJA4_9ACTN|nr:phosphotransferase family protein [Frankia nepalensis]MBL7501078.1 phosphotransferase family protein [Frankia nepalensis]MBL7514715.1 phosphotransferase family protein [Frankia nepalensis]MBL7524566.1 phosphotransferase family protein [Frankia nepalensis]MBL7631272.1 phosphotransferase family protein [Frankia nepalensis]
MDVEMDHEMDGSGLPDDGPDSAAWGAGAPGDGVDARLLAAWLGASLDPAPSSVAVSRLPGGHSSGVWRVDTVTGGGVVPMILKAPDEPSVVYQRDACREARILAGVHRMGAPVPEVLAVDTGEATGRRCFVMEHVEGRGVADSSAAGPHDDPWLRDAGPAATRAIWESFHDALAALHSVDAAKVPEASHGPRGVLDVLDYWRAALVDVAPAESVPRQLRLLDWLRDNVPPGADDAPAVCMGDARIANCLIAGTEARALVDFEVAYVGNPAADIAYSIFFDGLHRASAQQPLDGQPGADETWERWSRATGRPAANRAYWTAFGVTILCVTATRAMVQWGLADGGIESANTLVDRWEDCVDRAARA